MDINKMSFGEFKEATIEKEGIVLLGCGGELNEWIEGVCNQLKEEEISVTATPEELFSNAIQLTTSGGRTDLVLVFNGFDNVNMGKMAIWRIRFGDCSWVSDYIVNYTDQHLFWETK